MAKRPLSPDEAHLWRRVAATVRPLPGRRVPASTSQPARAELTEALSFAPSSEIRKAPAFEPFRSKNVPALPPSNTLDANWDKRLATGTQAPDFTIDLHGHTLASAHGVLNHRLGDAIRMGARLILLITGRPARDNPRMPPTGRGVIRASVEDWLAAGPHSARIAAIRRAHPRHGGAGALYLVIRRDRHF
jgi:DNA-nicking Smr family endonuclease